MITKLYILDTSLLYKQAYTVFFPRPVTYMKMIIIIIKF